MTASAAVSSPAPADQRNPALAALCVEALCVALRMIGPELLEDDTDAEQSAAA